MLNEQFDIKGRSYILTGGAGLLGKQYIQALTEANANVIVADNNLTELDKIASKAHGENILTINTDITDTKSVHQLVENTLKHFGRIDGLVNNAALDPKFDPDNTAKHSLTFENYPLELWQKELSVNITGMFLCTQAVAPTMLQQGSGTIVNISSIYGLVGPDQRLYWDENSSEVQKSKPVTYSVTKSAVLGFSRYLAAYWRNKGIRVNTLTLGGVYNGHDEEFVRKYSSRTLLGRMARYDEYSGALLFLLSDASSYMTGSNLIVDGGWTAW